jgi:hypothetical protein
MFNVDAAIIYTPFPTSLILATRCKTTRLTRRRPVTGGRDWSTLGPCGIVEGIVINVPAERGKRDESPEEQSGRTRAGPDRLEYTE